MHEWVDDTWKRVSAQSAHEWMDACRVEDGRKFQPLRHRTETHPGENSEEVSWSAPKNDDVGREVRVNERSVGVNPRAWPMAWPKFGLAGFNPHATKPKNRWKTWKGAKK